MRRPVTASSPPPTLSIDALLASVTQAHAQLSPQLQRIARDVEAHRDTLGLDRIQDVATRCDVHPSAVVRFAKRFGYAGFSGLQKEFRAEMALHRHAGAAQTYQTRIRQAAQTMPHKTSAVDVAQQSMAASASAMQLLPAQVPTQLLAQAIALLQTARTVWVVGCRRAFPVASYFAYALQESGKPVQFITGVGHMDGGQLRSMQKTDVLLLASFAPYAPETRSCVDHALTVQTPVIALTDSAMSPFAALASVCMVVREGSTLGFRSLTNTLCVAQSLVVALTYQLEKNPTSSSSSSRKSP